MDISIYQLFPLLIIQSRSYFPTKTQTSYETGQSFEKINQESDNPARRAKRISIANSQVINKAVGSGSIESFKGKGRQDSKRG